MSFTSGNPERIQLPTKALAETALRGIIPRSRMFAWIKTRMIKPMPYLPVREAAHALVLKKYTSAT